MDNRLNRVRGIVEETIGHKASPIFMNRVDDALKDYTGDRESLCNACARVKKIVYLFISMDDAEVIGSRFKQVIDETV